MADSAATLQALENLSTSDAYYEQHTAALNIREKAIREAALTLGIQSGLAKESKKINQMLESYGQQMDKIYNFNLLTIGQNVLPPVIVQASNNLKIGASGDQIRIGGLTYRMISQVRFVTAVPTWRDYLYMSYKQAQLPNKTLLPENNAERDLWKAYVRNGWHLGIQQAVQIFQVNLNRLSRDYQGMVRYKRLLMEGLVTPTYVDRKQHGITGDKKHIVIDDQTWTIQDKPEMRPDSKLWNPLFSKNPNVPEKKKE